MIFIMEKSVRIDEVDESRATDRGRDCETAVPPVYVVAAQRYRLVLGL
ncbi:hypothetical protein [Nocardia noduli]|nr:hypothetical protein [Nocardia noduli]